MIKQFKTIFFLLLLLTSLNGVAQSISSDQENSIKGDSRLDLGISLYDKAKSNLYHGFTFSYERFVSSNLSIEADMFANLFNRNGYGDLNLTQDLGSLGRNSKNYRNRFSLSLAVNYYLKKNTGSGHYLSFIANNVIALTDIAEHSIGGTNPSIQSRVDKGVTTSLPVLGLYYGYRKDFKSGFFIDGKVGLGHRISPLKDYKPENDFIMDFKISLGWRIDFKKKGKN